MPSPSLRIGLISDTHGLLRPEALTALAGADAILHAGDVGDPSILADLARIAPVTAVLGNNDLDTACANLPEAARLVFGRVSIDLIHDLKELAPGERHVVVSGHSHRPKIETRNGVLYVNPGSAGRRRFKLPISVAWLLIDGDCASATVKILAVA